ncbi:hypothetical protein GCM10028793_54150 [Nocardiopsis oceani]
MVSLCKGHAYGTLLVDLEARLGHRSQAVRVARIDRADPVLPRPATATKLRLGTPGIDALATAQTSPVNRAEDSSADNAVSELFTASLKRETLEGRGPRTLDHGPGGPLGGILLGGSPRHGWPL